MKRGELSWMCKSLWMYPLIKLKDDKQKLLFDYGVNVKNREEYDYLTNGIKKDFKYGSLVSCKIKSLNNIVHDPDFKEFVKMVNVPCGCCSECLKDRSRQWALRILKEAEPTSTAPTTTKPLLQTFSKNFEVKYNSPDSPIL